MPSQMIDPTENNQSEKEAEAKAYAQGKANEEALQADKDATLEAIAKESEEQSLIDGKFKSQEDLLAAYKELEKKLHKPEEEQTEEEAPQEEQPEELPQSEQSMQKAADVFKEKGELTPEVIEDLAKMDSKDLVKAYMDFYGKNQKQALQQNAVEEIHGIAGGEQGYNDLMQWASTNLPEKDVMEFNKVAESNNATAIKFAVEALNNRFKNSEGYEGQLITGKSPTNDGLKPYRSHAELVRDIGNPLYHSDPAFRQDVEQRLARSPELL
jgi:hypothetical protein